MLASRIGDGNGRERRRQLCWKPPTPNAREDHGTQPLLLQIGVHTWLLLLKWWNQSESRLQVAQGQTSEQSLSGVR